MIYIMIHTHAGGSNASSPPDVELNRHGEKHGKNEAAAITVTRRAALAST